MTQSIIDQAAEEYFNPEVSYNKFREMEKNAFKAGVTWRDEHVKELVEELIGIKTNIGFGGQKNLKMALHRINELVKTLSAFKTKEKL